MLSTEKNNNLLRISVGQDVLQKFANLVLQKYSNYLRDWTIEEKNSENFIYFNQKALLKCHYVNAYMIRISSSLIVYVLAVGHSS